MNVGIYGYLGYNLGDNLLFQITSEHIKEIYPDANIYRYGKYAYQPTELFPDILISIGGMLIGTDETFLDHYLAPIKKCKREGRKVIFYGIGVNPIVTYKCALKIEEALNNTIVFVRDKLSYERLKRIGVECLLGADPLFTKELNNLERGTQKLLVPIKNWRNYNWERLIVWADVVEYFDKKEGSIMYNASFKEIINWFKFSKAIVTRYHSVVLCLLMNIPFILLNYNDKCKELVSRVPNYKNFVFEFGTGFEAIAFDPNPEEVIECVENLQFVVYDVSELRKYAVAMKQQMLRALV